MKHLVMDARAATPLTDGLGTYIRRVMPVLASLGERSGAFRSTILAFPEVVPFWREAAPNAVIVASAIPPMRIGQNVQVARQIGPLAPDLYFYPAHDPPLFPGVPFAFTIHDVTLFRLKPYFERLDRIKRGYLQIVTGTAVRRSRAVFAVSETTRLQVAEVFGARHLPKIHATPNGIEQRAPLPPSTNERDILLYVGSDRPHKNVLRLVRAYAAASRRAPGLPPLVIAGFMRSRAMLDEAIRAEGIGDAVSVVGHVSDAALEASYARAIALLFPSVAEGFGLPILEAMIRGVPVLTSNISACAEVADDAALTVDPYSVEAIADGILRLANEPALRAALVEKGRERAAHFTWSRTASLTFDVLAREIAGPPR